MRHPLEPEPDSLREWTEAVSRFVVDHVASLGVPLQAQLPGLDAGADRLTRRLDRRL